MAGCRSTAHFSTLFSTISCRAGISKPDSKTATSKSQILLPKSRLSCIAPFLCRRQSVLSNCAQFSFRGKCCNMGVTSLGQVPERNGPHREDSIMWVELWVGISDAIPSKLLKELAGTTGLEPAASAVTGQRSNQLNYVPNLPNQR